MTSCAPSLCVCWPTTPLAVLSSIVTHFLWTSRGMRGWPFENYGCFRSAITGDERPELGHHKNSYCLRLRLHTPPQTKQVREKGGSREEWKWNTSTKIYWNQSVLGKFITLAQMRQMNRLVPQSRPCGQFCVLNQPSVQVFGGEEGKITQKGLKREI